MGGIRRRRNWALKNLPFKHEWVLIVDADEHITAESAEEIRKVVAEPGDKVGYYINRKLFSWGGG